MDPVNSSDLGQKTAQDMSVVIFTKKLCPFCKTMKKILAKIEAEKNEITFLEIDENDNPEAKMEFKIKRLPTILFFKNGEVKERLSSIANKTKINEILASIG